MIALFAHGQSDRQAIALWRERAGRVGSVGTRWIFQAIEVENDLPWFIQAVAGEAGIKKAAGAISSGPAGRVAKDEEKFGHSGIFEYGFKPEFLSLNSEFRHSGNRLIVTSAHESGECDRFLRQVRAPFSGHPVSRIGREPLDPVKTGDAGRMRILDAQSEALLPADDVHIQSADGDARGNLVLVGLGAKSLGFCGSSRHT